MRVSARGERPILPDNVTTYHGGSAPVSFFRSVKLAILYSSRVRKLSFTTSIPEKEKLAVLPHIHLTIRIIRIKFCPTVESCKM